MHKASVVVCAGCFLLLLVLIGDYWWDHKARVQVAQEDAQQVARKAAAAIQDKLEKITTRIDAVATDLGTGTLKKTALQERLQQITYMDPELSKVGFAFEPFAYQDSLRLYGVAWNAAAERIEIDARYDYTINGNEGLWYRKPRDSVQPHWFPPTVDDGLFDLETVYAVPFFVPAASPQQPVGVVFAALPVAYFRTLLTEFQIGETGFAYIQSKQGSLIYHPDQDLMKTDESLDEADLHTTQRRWVFNEAIEAAAWDVNVVAFKEDISLMSEELRRDLVKVVLGLFLFLSALSIPLFKIYTLTEPKLWVFFGLVSFLCFGTISSILYLRMRIPGKVGEQGHTDRITNVSTLNTFRRDQMRKALEQNSELPVFIPTGVFIQSVNFDQANDVSLTGYIWQKYHLGLHDDVARGFVMPEKQTGTINEVYRDTTDGVELIGSYFEVSLRQEFDYSKYPFGRENVWIQIWHQEFHRNVVLIPDLEAYQFISPSSRPGISKQLILPGWSIDRSYFSYTLHSYTTNFGFRNYVGQKDFPEMYFNIIIRKELIGPFVSHLLPLNVILIMLFTLLLAGSRSEKKASFLGFSALNVITSCAAFFLVAIFSHIDLRERLAAKDILFLEYFYFVTYFLILMVSINSLLFAFTDQRWVIYKDNLIPKILYWPVSQSLILAFALWNLY